jgi:hypothetical protein
MAIGKKNVIVYTDWISTFELLSDDEAGKLIKHFFRYVNDQEPQPPDRLTEILFEPIRSTLKRDLSKWELKAEKARINGKGGGRPKTENNPEKPDRLFIDEKKPVSVSVSVSDSVSVKENNSLTTILTDSSHAQNKLELEFRFNLFWNAYDKKTGKNKVRQKFDKLKEQEIVKIMEHVPKYIDSTPDKNFRKDPLTYLNGKHWEDEIIQRTQIQIHNTHKEYDPNAHTLKIIDRLAKDGGISAKQAEIARLTIINSPTRINVQQLIGGIEKLKTIGDDFDIVSFRNSLRIE